MTDVVTLLADFRCRVLEHAEEEERMARDPNYVYTSIWIVHRPDLLPENPTWLDYMRAGAVFQGYQWVRKEAEEPNDSESTA